VTTTFVLPPEAEASSPPEWRGLARDEVRLMAVARVEARRADGALVPLHVSTQLDDGDWVVELRRRDNSGPDLGAEPGTALELPGGLAVTLLQGYPDPFSAEVVVRLVARGVAVAPLVLHTGVSSPELHEPPYPERFAVPGPTARLVELTRANGGRVVAVGTTVTRALETAADADGTVRATSGWTSLVLGPDRPARVVTGLVTGLHAPEASHLQLLEAVAGAPLVSRAYEASVPERYLWHEFGDSMLFLP
jgi:S-adenosylmethionine:tRNA ribosyltransferase-isomerase